MENKELTYYPEHPSGEKAHKKETWAMPVLSQGAPFDAKILCSEIMNDVAAEKHL